MGTGIVAALLDVGIDVDLVETDRSAIERANERVLHLVESVYASQNPGELAVYTSFVESRSTPDMVVEAVPEIPELKSEVLAEAERVFEPALLATNTSSISVNTLAEGLRNPERLVGLHFFNPVHRMELIELVVGARTSKETVELGQELVALLGKQPVTVSDSPGFASTRLGITLGLEAIRMLEEGVAAAEDIDRAMVLGYGHPVGPLRLTDAIGLDVRLNIARVMERAYGERFRPPALLETMVAEGRLGRKSGEGFYLWPN